MKRAGTMSARLQQGVLVARHAARANSSPAEAVREFYGPKWVPTSVRRDTELDRYQKGIIDVYTILHHHWGVTRG